MLEGEKTQAFWAGLFLSGLTIFLLFTSIWDTVLYPPSWTYITPWIFGSAVFLIIGLYMMKAGVKKEEEIQPMK